jgi:hypothetical protein
VDRLPYLTFKECAVIAPKLTRLREQQKQKRRNMSDNSLTVAEGNFLAPAAGLRHVLEAYQAKKEFYDQVLKKGVDYGVIPGSDKPALLKPGAEKLASFFGLSPVFHDVQTAEDWTGKDHNEEPFFYYRQKCELNLRGRVIATADGSCNSWEKKYRYRQANRKCPACGIEAIIKGKEEYGGGWLCWKKKSGCGATFKAGDQSIEGQEAGVVKNQDVAEQVNTILKMAQKRALIAAVLIATNTSDYFTEDFIQGDWHEAEPQAQPQPARDEPPAFDLKGNWKSPKVSYDLACTVKDKNGTAYTEINIAKLPYMRRSIEKSMGLEENIERVDYMVECQLKLDTIDAILEASS